jgi:hypothetical protein
MTGNPRRGGCRTRVPPRARAPLLHGRLGLNEAAPDAEGPRSLPPASLGFVQRTAAASRWALQQLSVDFGEDERGRRLQGTG